MPVDRSSSIRYGYFNVDQQHQRVTTSLVTFISKNCIGVFKGNHADGQKGQKVTNRMVTFINGVGFWWKTC
jgi:hypothetical protein